MRLRGTSQHAPNWMKMNYTDIAWPSCAARVRRLAARLNYGVVETMAQRATLHFSSGLTTEAPRKHGHQLLVGPRFLQNPGRDADVDFISSGCVVPLAFGVSG